MRLLLFTMVSSVLLGALVLRAENGPNSKEEEAVQREIVRLDAIKPRPSLRPLNNVSLSYQLGLNMRATFTGFGTSVNTFAGSNPGPATHPANHEYDDGYNRIDSTGNNHSSQQGFANTTTFWGYEHDSQWNHADNTISMHSSHPTQFGELSNDDPRHGFEIAYERIMGECQHFYWGIEGSFGFTTIDFNESRTQIAPVLTTTDKYAIPFDEVIGTNSVPASPYHGPFEGDLGSSLLSDIPNRTVAPNGEVATLVAQRHLDANVWRVHVGPKLHVPVNNRLELQFAGGMAIGVVDSHFNFTEQVFFPSSVGGGGPQLVQQGAAQTEGANVGPYLSGQLVVPLWPDSRIFAGVQWEDLGKFHNSIGSHTAQIDLRDALSVSFGFAVGF
jgi:hypothetical protein